MPEAGDTVQFVENIAAVVEADLQDNRRPSGEGELFDCKRVMVAPAALEFVQALLRGNLNASADWKLLVIRRHHKLGAVISVCEVQNEPQIGNWIVASRSIFVAMNFHSRATDRKSVSRHSRRKASSVSLEDRDT